MARIIPLTVRRPILCNAADRCAGTKKWITNGTFCDYFVTGVKTAKGFSMLLIERQDGLDTSQIKTSYSAAAGTAYVTFDNVRVPVENLLGKEDQGFKVIMTNFNHERWMIATASVVSSRVVVQDCIQYANQRRVFGKRLIDEPVIRQKYVTPDPYLHSANGTDWRE
jgi:alkylation response protein AidB-like acyl-CoA dehydrogenase